MKRCIFHYPGPIKDNPVVGSEVRPSRMLSAFKEIGYDVTVISGYSKERKARIRIVKDLIDSGVDFEFVYSESTTMPTALSDSDHLPRNPFLDESFFAFCKHRNIPVGLFYRDAYWQFDYYKERVKKWVPYITIPFYRHELKKYNRCTDILFVPSDEFAEAIKYESRYKELPSGGMLALDRVDDDSEVLKLFYVGGVTGINSIDTVVETVKRCGFVYLTICCPKEQWEESGLKVDTQNEPNIRVVHEHGGKMVEYLKKSDVALALFERNPYRDLAMPVKLFEYICTGKPIITTKGTAAGRYVESNNIGWAIDYDANQLEDLLYKLQNREKICQKKDNAERIAPKNTWSARAEFVAEQLTGIM